jgi:transcriptional regulator of acetoin/glycerol metabolism
MGDLFHLGSSPCDFPVASPRRVKDLARLIGSRIGQARQKLETLVRVVESNLKRLFSAVDAPKCAISTWPNRR